MQVLDFGRLEIVDSMGGDLSVVNSARVSFNVCKEVLDKSDVGLINYLVKNKHDSPLRHTQISFRIKAPEFVMRQWYKHIVGATFTVSREPDGAWNEVSGRYVEYADEFYTPDIFRAQSKSNKQGTTAESVESAENAKKIYTDSVAQSYASYKSLLDAGVGREIARTILPLNYYTEVIWTASLQAVLNFITLRDHEHAQYEIRVYASAMRELVKSIAPLTMIAWEKHRI
jgi:thymidylate synthase (FAD)